MRLSVLFLFCLLLSCTSSVVREPDKLRIVQDPDSEVQFPEVPNGEFGREILYGREIIVNTSYYFGTKGIVKPLLGNSFQCQSCHLNAGTRLFGNHFLMTYKKYPGYFSRFGREVSLEDRINLCLKDHYPNFKNSFPPREMKAIKNYFRWISFSKIESTEDDKSSFLAMDPPGRKASRERGKKVYIQHCLRCHGKNGRGEESSDKSMLVYPPLWGEKSYSINSPFLQNFKLAQFIRANMPYGASADNPILSEEESLDVAAFINNLKSHSRCGERDKKAFKNSAEKPFDYPFGPYPDSFNQEQHRLGPFVPILEFRLSKKLPTLSN